MKIRYLILVLFIFAFVSCNEKDELLVKDIAGNDVNLLASKKDKIIMISCGMVCHDCVRNLDAFLAEHYKLSDYDYSILYEDPNAIPARRATWETYKNGDTRNIQRMTFCAEDSTIMEKLAIPENLFIQLTPYLIYIGKDNKPIYKSFEEIFNNDRSGTVKKSFKIK
jgi:hypothetical protein